MKTNIRTTNIVDTESDFVLMRYKGKSLQDIGLVYTPYIPTNMKYITEGIENEWTTFTFNGYDSYAVAAWANDNFGKTVYNLRDPNFIKIYLVDPNQITAMRLTWL